MGVLVGGSICLQNVSFLFVTVALYTMVGATVPVFQLCWALSPCFQLEKPSRGLVSAILCVVSGLVLIAYGATEVNPIGAETQYHRLFMIQRNASVLPKKICARISWNGVMLLCSLQDSSSC